MEGFPNETDRGKPMACEDCSFYKSSISQAGPDSLEVLKECNGSQPNEFSAGGCGEITWKCGHPYMTNRQAFNQHPVKRVIEEMIVLSALREQIDN